MKMQYLFLPFFAVLLTACDNIAAGDRLVEVPPATVRRNVLVEEFTGQRCLNCPGAAEYIEALQHTYSADNLIAVAIHSGNLALFDSGKTKGLRTALGDDYYRKWNVGAVPHALINRRLGTAVKDTWATCIYKELQQETNLSLALYCSYRADTRTVDVKVQLHALSTAVEGHLQLWLVEDSIVAMQQFPGNRVERNYIHNHVLRSAVNGDWGTKLLLADNERRTETFRHVLANDIAPRNAWIVAFVYNDDGVLQVVRRRII